MASSQSSSFSTPPVTSTNLRRELISLSPRLKRKPAPMNGRLLSGRIEGGCRARWSLEGLYPCLSRDTSAKILEIVANATHDKQIAIYESLKFANDGLFCEWAYVNDMDKDTLEIYAGHETNHHGHCVNDVGAEDETVPAFVISFDFSRLYIMTGPEEFLKGIPKISNSEEQTVVEDGDAYNLFMYRTGSIFCPGEL